MIKVASVQTVRDIESEVNATLMTYDQMMQNAGKAAAHYIMSRFTLTTETRITLLVGKGNNGGDGLVVAHILSQESKAQVRIYMLEKRFEGEKNYAAVVEDGLYIAIADNDSDRRLLKSIIQSSDIVIDAMFGIGIRLPIRDAAANILRSVNQTLKRSDLHSYGDIATIDPTKPKQFGNEPRPYILAIDCPSGVNCDTGEADSNTIAADDTITFIAAKRGLFMFPAAKYVGNLVVSQIGIPDEQPTLKDIKHIVLDHNLTKQTLPRRPIDGHKGTFGKALIVSGSHNYVGAAALASEACYRAGSGLVTLASVSTVIKTVANRLREPTFIHLDCQDGAIASSSAENIVNISDNYNAMLIGCGLGQHPSTQECVISVLNNDNLPPLVLDADALNILSQSDKWWESIPYNTIITPHPGEMARLTKQSISKVNRTRWEMAQKMADQWGVVVVLKGAHTIMASPEGHTSVMPFKTDALATAGTGDVLAGLITGFRTQGLSAYDSAIVGSYLHAICGELAREIIGSSRAVIAGDIIKVIGQAFKQLES